MRRLQLLDGCVRHPFRVVLFTVDRLGFLEEKWGAESGASRSKEKESVDEQVGNGAADVTLSGVTTGFRKGVVLNRGAGFCFTLGHRNIVIIRLTLYYIHVGIYSNAINWQYPLPHQFSSDLPAWYDQPG